MYSLKESPPKTSKVERQVQDLENITNAFINADLSIETSSIRDCFRLGKYKPDASRPRPILIKFLRSTEATMALFKMSAFKAPVHIKPDLTQEEREVESFLLKERWSLTQSGFDKKRIKIRNNCIFIDNIIYGQYHNAKLHRSQYNPPLSLPPQQNQHSNKETTQLEPVSRENLPPNLSVSSENLPANSPGEHQWPSFLSISGETDYFTTARRRAG